PAVPGRPGGGLRGAPGPAPAARPDGAPGPRAAARPRRRLPGRLAPPRPPRRVPGLPRRRRAGAAALVLAQGGGPAGGADAGRGRPGPHPRAAARRPPRLRGQRRPPHPGPGRAAVARSVPLRRPRAHPARSDPRRGAVNTRPGPRRWSPANGDQPGAAPVSRSPAPARLASLVLAADRELHAAGVDGAVLRVGPLAPAGSPLAWFP